MPTMDDLFELRANPDVQRTAKADRHRQQLLVPMHRLYGRGPEGARCGACRHLLRTGNANNTYLKCALGPRSHGPGTDWRARWPACGRFQTAD